jgi:ATP-dependent RNA helicase DeaD
MAAALAFLVQKHRPLLPVKHVSERRPSKDKPERESKRSAEREPRQTREPREPRQVRERKHQPEEGMKTFRVEVGAADNVEPKHLVGAIANEAGLESQFIGRISIMDDHSFVDLPDGMPKDIFQHLGKVWVNNKQLKISLPDDVPAVTNDRKTARPARKNEAPRKRLSLQKERSKAGSKRR